MRSIRTFVRFIALMLCLAVAIPTAQAQVVRVKTYLELKAKQQWVAALDVIREEIASPILRTGNYLADLRAIALGALGDVANHLKFDAAMDEEAARYYREGLQHASGDSQREGNVRQTYARYFSDSRRNGLALPYIRANYEFWKKRDNPFMVFNSLDALASAYNDMGENGLRDHYREQSLAAAAAYFARAAKPTPNQWLQYHRVIQKRMDNVAREGGAAALDPLWAIDRDITQRFLQPKSPSISRVAVYYAISGASERAAQLMAEAEELWTKESAGVADNLRGSYEGDFDSKRGTIAFHAGRYPESKEFLERTYQNRMKSGLALEDLALHRYRGLVFEQLGELELAAEAFQRSIRPAEALRQSYSVGERAAFFRSTVQRSYHGLIRVSAIQAARDGSIERFWEAVQASEMVRARQLGDLIDPNAPAIVSRQALESIRGSLGAGRAVIYFTVAGESLVVLGFTQDRQVASIQPIDASFAPNLRRLARDLARPDSPVDRLEGQLLQLSKTVLGPVADLVQSRTELVVLPDGVLNLVPFDLLSADMANYRPLMETHRVKLAPSLRFVGRTAAAPGSGALYALADPAYRKPDGLAGLDQAELKVATRGSRYLEYFQRLPETRTEVEAIKGMFTGARVQTVYGEQATESAIKQTDLSGFSFLHFATHGILGGEIPGIGEPALVLSAEPKEDGFLTASEIAALKLDAQLAVLSACDTGSGEYVTGEGVLGLSRAFLIAGSRAVVVSLWPVASKATERLMVMFYTNLRAGQDPHEALRNAKLQFVKAARAANSAERHPMFWAPFVVFGA